MNASNKYREHLVVLVEDDANRQMINGFRLTPNLDERRLDIRPISKGYLKVLADFTDTHLKEVINYPEQRMLLPIDFDEKFPTRLEEFQQKIPDDIAERVFILGTFSNPEKLKDSINRSYEQIGEALAQDCIDKTEITWGHDLLKHNKAELDRMILTVKKFLFPT